jgi:hypothetical protein
MGRRRWPASVKGILLKVCESYRKHYSAVTFDLSGIAHQFDADEGEE